MFAVLHIADFALHAVLRNEPGTSGVEQGRKAPAPAALFSGNSKKSVALAVNSPARAAGVELGMTASQAVARCPLLLIRAPRPAAEAEARAALLAVGFTVSPAIEDTAPGVCTIDLRGRTHESLTAATAAKSREAPKSPAPPASRSAATSYISSVRTAISQLTSLGLPASAGIAHTPLLALYAARAAGRSGLRPDPSTLRLPFAVCESSANDTLAVGDQVADLTYLESDGILVVTDAKSFLSPLPLATADPSIALAEVLANWGLRTLGDLTALPRDEIVRRFGSEGLALWQRASGGDQRPLHPVVPAETFSAHMEFEEEIATLEPLLFILRRFLDRLTLELCASQHVASELHLTLRLEDDTQHTRSFRLPEPTADTEILFRALYTHLESLQTAASITAVQLHLTPTRPLVRQQDLFETGLRDPYGFAETLARVSALVGNDRVGTPQTEDTHRPDAVKLVTPAAVIPPSAEPPLHMPVGLPLRRFRPPVPARVELTDGRATYLWTDRVHGEICAQSTAFPSSGEWWQPDRAWRRTEWDVALAQGGLYRVILIGDSYFIEGEYD